MYNSNFLLGADPELFMSNKEGKILSAIGKLGGTKDHPVQVKGMKDGFAYQEDNVLIEYNIPPADSCKTFVNNNKQMLTYLSNKVDAIMDGARLSIISSHIMDDDQLEDPRAHVFGCDPDFDAWTLKPNARPRSANPSLRSAGGHLHIGFRGSRMDKVMLVRLLDLHFGLWIVRHDKDKRRRELYGKAGAYREKSYGVEYRTPSNFWLTSVSNMETAHRCVARAMSDLKAGGYEMIDGHGQKIRECINDGTQDDARALMDFFFGGEW